MKLILTIFVAVASTAAAMSQDKQIKSCVDVIDNNQRLHCYDYIFKNSSKTKNTKINLPMKVSDFIVDFSEINEKEVQVFGYAVKIDDILAIYENAGSSTKIYADIQNLERENMRELLARCGSTCRITVTGFAKKLLIGPGIAARQVTIN